MGQRHGQLAQWTHPPQRQHPWPLGSAPNWIPKPIPRHSSSTESQEWTQRLQDERSRLWQLHHKVQKPGQKSKLHHREQRDIQHVLTRAAWIPALQYPETTCSPQLQWSQRKSQTTCPRVGSNQGHLKKELCRRNPIPTPQQPAQTAFLSE